ncbi:CBS domain-containing protein [Methanohalophilus mahii]|uniref:CBS domain containing membrane protein n=1 Tax=Methanohalophilus mahii (strain ATCC 35705 / DSM 5219 / SLP) TaxID=547558 RepID=D5E9Z8_METMS|nr:CBS domain-containing protein [Methanohalophilus mahii]ADE35999.1 CBS domain containing membrane protein [Methanohalophilus mahii DSM 5219]
MPLDAPDKSKNPDYRDRFQISKQCATKKIIEVMTVEVVGIDESSSIEDTLELIGKYRFHNFPVVDKDYRLKGVIDQNIVLELLFHDRLPSSSHTHLTAVRSLGEDAKSIMIPHPLKVSRDTSLCEGVDMMLKHNINHVWVVDNDDKLIGVITKHDVINEAYRTRSKK